MPFVAGGWNEQIACDGLASESATLIEYISILRLKESQVALQRVSSSPM